MPGYIRCYILIIVSFSLLLMSALGCAANEPTQLYNVGPIQPVPKCTICGYYVYQQGLRWLRIDEDGTWHATYDSNGTWTLKVNKIMLYGPVSVQEGIITGNTITIGQHTYIKE